MKKLVRVSMSYMIIGLLFGVYYRELTKWFDFSGKTQLSTLHTYVSLGIFFFLIVLLLEKNFHITAHKWYKRFYITYNIGLGITLLLMLIHGTMTVMGIESSAAISGVAGLGHIIMTIGLGFFFAILFGSVEEHA